MAKNTVKDKPKPKKKWASLSRDKYSDSAKYALHCTSSLRNSNLSTGVRISEEEPKPSTRHICVSGLGASSIPLDTPTQSSASRGTNQFLAVLDGNENEVYIDVPDEDLDIIRETVLPKLSESAVTNSGVISKREPQIIINDGAEDIALTPLVSVGLHHIISERAKSRDDIYLRTIFMPYGGSQRQNVTRFYSAHWPLLVRPRSSNRLDQIKVRKALIFHHRGPTDIIDFTALRELIDYQRARAASRFGKSAQNMKDKADEANLLRNLIKYAKGKAIQDYTNLIEMKDELKLSSVFAPDLDSVYKGLADPGLRHKTKGWHKEFASRFIDDLTSKTLPKKGTLISLRKDHIDMNTALEVIYEELDS